MAPRAVLFAQQGNSLAPRLCEVLKVYAIESICAASPDHLRQIIDSFFRECVIVVCTAVVDDDTLRIVEQVRRIDRDCPLLILTSAVSTEWAIRAMRAGASDLLEGSAPSQTVARALRSLLERCRTVLTCDTQNSQLIGGSRIVGRSAAIARRADHRALD